MNAGARHWITAQIGTLAAINDVPALGRVRQGEPLRAADQSHLCGHGGLLSFQLTVITDSRDS